MAPVRSKKRDSDQLAESPLKKSMVERIPLLSGSDASQPRSPIRKRMPGTITMAQKQAMIDNMQLEITERARRLRAQYNYMATTVRSRIEMRLNRVPMSLRNVKMGDLLQKCMDQEQQRAAKSAAQRKPPITRGASPPKQIQSNTHNLKPAARTQKRISDAISGDKENEVDHNEMAKKRARAATTTDVSYSRPGQILSPTSSNSRMANRPVSPVKTSGIARPASPLKRPATATGMLSNMVEKAKASRAGVTRKTMTNSNTTSSSTNNTVATKNKKAPIPATTTARAPTSRPGTRTTRRSIANSESSESSNGTVIRKGAAAKSTTAKKGTTTTRKGATGAIRKTTAKTNSSAASTGTGRTLRKRA